MFMEIQHGKCAYCDDPASLIDFHGFSPKACGDTPYKRRRGLVSIAFFHLDDPKRKYLFRERADTIVSLFSFLKLADQAATQDEKQIWENLIKLKTQPSAPHTNCAQSFCKIHQKNKADAEELFRLSTVYLNSISS